MGDSVGGDCYQPQTGTWLENLPAPEQQQQGHLPSASAETELCAAAADNLQHSLRGIQGGERGTLCSRETGGIGLQTVRYFLDSWS